MSTRDRVVAFAVLALALRAGVVLAEGPQLGRPVDAQTLRRLDLTILPDGNDLPPGRGSVAEGRAVFAAKCAACHGVDGKDGLMDTLTGGVGSLTSPKPVKTVNSYWPYATTVFDYIRRAMPLTAPRSLSANEVYAVTAYLLSIDGVVKPDATLDAKSLPRVRMPNRDGFLLWWPAPPPSLSPSSASASASALP